jgi:diguanylate cyclase (GGDEF)-like protein
MSSFFDLSVQLEKDKQKMIATILRVRNSLDTIKERQKQLELETQRLSEKAETDQLTGIANRYRMSRFTQEALERCRAEHIPLSYEILDIDYFKQYNDEYGHQVGDECVKAVAGLLSGIENENIFCARYGGDEFVIVYVGVDVKEVEETAQRLRQQVCDLNIQHNGSSEYSIVTISQGICHDIPCEDCKDREFLHAADEYLYVVKKKGRNAVCIGNLKGEEIRY